MAKAATSLPSKIPTIYTATGAACWASYLINGDASGLRDAERLLADAWREREIGPNCVIVCCSQPYFSWNDDLCTGNRLIVR
jgi:hypothetical protein